MKIIGLPIPLKNDISVDPPQQKFLINYFTEESNTEQIASCFPVKIKAGSAGWMHAVTILEGDKP